MGVGGSAISFNATQHAAQFMASYSMAHKRLRLAKATLDAASGPTSLEEYPGRVTRNSTQHSRQFFLYERDKILPLNES